MNELFGARDLSAYQASLEGYTNAVTREATDQSKLNKEADEYNETLTGITDPIGLLVGGKPVEELVKKGLKKALGKTVESVVSKAKGAINDKAKINIDDLLKGDIRAKDLAKRTQEPRPTPQGEGDLVEPRPTNIQETRFDESMIPKQQQIPEGAGEIAEGAEADAPSTIPAEDVAKLTQPPPSASGTDEIAGEAGAAAEEDGTDSAIKSAAEKVSQLGGKLTGKLAKSAAKEGIEGGTSALLDGVETGADIAAGSEGGLNPVADVIAGAVGLATLLGGIFGEKKAQVAAAPTFIPSAQFGT